MTAAGTSLRNVLRKAIPPLSAAGIEDAAADARILASAAFGLSREDMLRDPDALLSMDVVSVFREMIGRRHAREPVSRILGKREFFSLEFEVVQATLDPRPDSETVVEAALDIAKGVASDLRILDIGTGTGCLLLSAMHRLPAVHGVGTDIDPEAVACAGRNASTLGLADRVEFHSTTWTEGVKAPFDIVLSNPPYIPSEDIPGLAPEVKEHDPTVALDGGVDGMEAYRMLAKCIGPVLSPGGTVILETGPGQARRVATIFNAAGYRFDGSRRDLAGHERALILSHDGGLQR
ncbi:MAG: peptide chain release factor N(5)-glutamine methyltransferase [Pseudomonadota bacterium]|nr:peptide chain release factor N(5)-glutamine methyltransferase [Pseudomonadota bacterium]